MDSKCRVSRWIRGRERVRRLFGGPLELAQIGTCSQHGLGATLDRRVFEGTSILPLALRPESADGLRRGDHL